MAALFACTKCHSRHPFEDLSENEQICKRCRIFNTAVKCTYCRTEFQNEDKSVLSAVCRNCAHLVKLHGKPKACEYCKEMAAFVGRKCQHCTIQEKKYGAPLTCDRCKNQCAFNRGEEYRQSMDGRLLCWLCIVSHKRSKLRQQRDTMVNPLQRQLDGGSHGNTPYSPTTTTPIVQTTIAMATDKPSPGWLTGVAAGGTPLSGGKERGGVGGVMDTSQSSSSQKPKMVLKRKDEVVASSSSPKKRSRNDKSLSNGLVVAGRSSTGDSSAAALDDFSGSAHVVMATQLRETVEAMKKQLQSRDQLIMQKDQKITELKAHQFEMEKEMRNKMQILQKQHDDSMELLQTRIRDLQKKLLSVSKGSKSRANYSPPSPN